MNDYGMDLKILLDWQPDFIGSCYKVIQIIKDLNNKNKNNYMAGQAQMLTSEYILKNINNPDEVLNYIQMGMNGGTYPTYTYNVEERAKKEGIDLYIKNSIVENICSAYFEACMKRQCLWNITDETINGDKISPYFYTSDTYVPNEFYQIFWLEIKKQFS